jgi:hypothetical protein
VGDLVVSERTRILLPEVSIQAQANLGDLRPYVVAGVGMAVPLSGFKGDDGGTLHAGLGTRIVAGRRTLMRAEARARSISPWEGETLDLTLGIEWITR